MSIQKLEREFGDFCAGISPRELERNPKIQGEIGQIRRMIARIRSLGESITSEPEALENGDGLSLRGWRR